MNYIANALSLNMFEVGKGIEIAVTRVAPTQVPRDAVSAIGYPETAAAASQTLGWQVPANRISLKLDRGDCLFVFQYSGERLERGGKGLPQGDWHWYKISFSPM